MLFAMGIADVGFEWTLSYHLWRERIYLVVYGTLMKLLLVPRWHMIGFLPE